MSKAKKLFLLDSMALIYRAHFAFINNPRITSNGINTSALFGFTTTLFEIIEKEKPSHLAVVTDLTSKTFRHDEFPEYKAGRQDTPEDILAAIPMVKELCKAMEIPYLGYENWEADDIIGTIAKKAQDEDFEVYMMTPDKDFAQLVDENIYHYKPARPPKSAEILDVEKTKRKWEIKEIDQVRDILGLMGDKVDNIPGIPGVGQKTAIKLMRQYGTIENLVEHTNELKGKLKERVEGNTEQAILSKKLATINTNCPIEFDLSEFGLENYKSEELKDLFAQYEFRTLGRRIFGDKFSVPKQKGAGKSEQMNLFDEEEEEEKNSGFDSIYNLEDVETDYHLIKDTEEIQQLIQKLKKLERFAFDTETSSLNPITCQIVGMSFSWKKHEAYYIALNEEEDDFDKKLKMFEGIFNDSEKTLVGQNIKFDMKVMQQKGISIQNKLFDTMLAHYLIEPDGRHSMDILSEKYLGYTPVSIESIIGKKGKKQKSMADMKPEDISDYACEDADVTFQLHEVFKPKLEEIEATSLFEDIECPLVDVLTSIELQGIRVDKDFLADYSKELSEELSKTQEQIFEMAGEEFNLNSPKQLGEILFGKLELDPKAKKTKSGQYKTDEATLQKLEDKHDIVAHIMDYRQVSKLKSTYVDALPQLINADTGRVHTTFQQAVAATGRLSSNEPNLQNIPIRTEKGRKVRQAFVARNGDYKLFSADYSQVELRIVASISEDEAMIEAFNEGLDIHAATAARVFDVDVDKVSRDQRSRAKAVNFGIVYGQGAFGLAQSLGIKRTEAKEIIDQYFAKYSGLKKYMDEIPEYARKHGFVKTLLGRRRYLRDINSKNYTLKSFAERNAINSPIQGTAADIIKLAMISIHEEMKKKEMKSKMILQVHDELIFDAHSSEQEELSSLVKEKMSKAFKLKVPLVVDSAFGENWLEAH